MEFACLTLMLPHGFTTQPRKERHSLWRMFWQEKGGFLNSLQTWTKVQDLRQPVDLSSPARSWMMNTPASEGETSTVEEAPA